MQEQNLSKTYRGRKVFLCAFYSGNLYPTAMRFHREFRELQKALQDKFDIYIYIYITNIISQMMIGLIKVD